MVCHVSVDFLIEPILLEHGKSEALSVVVVAIMPPDILFGKGMVQRDLRTLCRFVLSSVSVKLPGLSWPPCFLG